MMNDLQQYIKTLQLPSRTDCPICGHRNTLSASVLEGFIIYNCFHASCKVKGKFNHDFSLTDLRNFDTNRLSPLRNLQRQATSPTNAPNSSGLIISEPKEYLIPDYWTNPLQNPRCLAFIKYWKLLDLYVSRMISLFFDPRLNRCVFLLRNHERKVLGATGRALTYPNNPKWYIYKRLDGCIFRIGGIYRQCILSEDCISACTSFNSTGMDSIALLGTSIPEATIQYLLDYDKVFIALDRDATSKAIKLQKQLSPYIKEVKVIPLEKDLKYYSNDELEELKGKLL